MRILLVNSTFPPFTIGGGPKIAGWLLQALQKEGHDVLGLCAAPPTPIVPDPLPDVRRILTPLGSWAHGPSPGRLARLRTASVHLREAKKAGTILDDFRPDVLFAVSFFNISCTVWTEAARRGVKTVLVAATADPPPDLFAPWGRLERAFFCLPEAPRPTDLGALVAPSRFALERHLRGGIKGRMTRVIPWGIPVDLFHPSQAPVRHEPPWRILWVGRPTAAKGCFDALDALREVRKHTAAVHMTLAGFAHPAEEARLAEEIQSRGLAGAVDRKTFLDEASLAEVYRDHDLLWITTRLPEALSLTLLEGLASGIPVLATSVGGNAEVVKRCRGVQAIPPGDPATLARAALELLRDPAQREIMRREGRAYAVKHHSRDDMGAAYTDLLTSVAALR